MILDFVVCFLMLIQFMMFESRKHHMNRLRVVNCVCLMVFCAFIVFGYFPFLPSQTHLPSAMSQIGLSRLEALLLVYS